jgi:hypothetical protein
LQIGLLNQSYKPAIVTDDSLSGQEKADMRMLLVKQLRRAKERVMIFHGTISRDKPDQDVIETQPEFCSHRFARLYVWKEALSVDTVGQYRHGFCSVSPMLMYSSAGFGVHNNRVRQERERRAQADGCARAKRIIAKMIVC